MHEIFFNPARSTRTCSGSRVFLWGARAASLRVSAASRNGLSTSACSGRIHNTSPVEDSPWRARTLASRQNGLSRIGEHTRLACNASPARTLGALAERTLSNRTRALRVPRNELFSEYSFAIALPRKQPPNVDYANFSGKFALAAN